MKRFAALSLGALFAVVTAVPLEKRDYYTTTIVEEVTDVVQAYTTIFVQPGDPRLNQGVLTSSVPAATVTTPVAQTSATSQPAVVPQPQQKEEVHVQAPAPTTTPTPSITPVPSTTPAPSVTPQVAAVAPVQAAPAPVSSAPAPVSSPSSGSTSSGASTPSGGDCASGGQCVASDVTTFDGTVGLGSCGKMDTVYSENYVALTHDMMGQLGNNSPFCGRKLSITNNGVTEDAVIADMCPGCSGQSLDLSPALFAKLFDGATTGRFHGIEWHFTS